ncbi:flagellar motor switch protein FliN [bacterium BMS3Abin04]|nr:flagellar motor switch protein FliN [bacterium BMS3Abin04]
MTEENLPNQDELKKEIQPERTVESTNESAVDNKEKTTTDTAVDYQETPEQTEVKTQVAEFPEFDESTKHGFTDNEKMEFLKDLELNVYIELGRTKMQIKDILELERGYVVELEKLASEPVDIFVNNKKIAEGEVVVIDKHFGIRITNLIEASERLQGLK